MSSIKVTDLTLDDLDDIDITLMTLRKPTELKKVIDSIPKPVRAVPKNGLPVWYKIGLESKLPVPKMPAGKIVFSRGKIGEDIRGVGLGHGGPRPTFDLTDPYCNNVSYTYVPMHDPHLAHHFAQKPARQRMTYLGFCTRDGRAVCSLKDFNQYRKYLYNRFMDRIHMEMKKLDERARDDLTMKRVENDVARRLQNFIKIEKAREHLERVAKEHADEWAEKKRLARETEKKLQARMVYLAEYNEKQRKDRVARAQEKSDRIKQRVQAAAEMELRRKITMVRQWRTNEKKRLKRVKMDRELKEKRLEDEATRKWTARVESQNMKIQEEAILLKVYSEDMATAAGQRARNAEIYAYNADLELQRLRLVNLKAAHGGQQKSAALVRKMGIEFEKSKRGAKGMSPELAMSMAVEAMAAACSTTGDPLMTLGQARTRMDMETVLPKAPIAILEELLEIAVVIVARGRVHKLMCDLENVITARAAVVFFQNFRSVPKRKRPKTPRWAAQLPKIAQPRTQHRDSNILFGEIVNISDEEGIDYDPKSVRDRPPTPVPSKTKLAEVTFSDRLDDLPDPVPVASSLPERNKLMEMVNAAARQLSKNISIIVNKGMDVVIGQVTLPRMRHRMEWKDAVYQLSDAVVNNRINSECPEVRRVSVYLSNRILRRLNREMKEEKKRIAMIAKGLENVEESKDFYVPGASENI